MQLALEHIRRMRGGAQAHLMRCENGGYYVVKFRNNPQHLHILANEMLATRLAARLGLCVPQTEIVEVRPELIAYTAELVVQLGVGSRPCVPGKQFGSRFPGHPARLAVHDFLPDEQLAGVTNLDHFLGILVLDKWTCNTNGRQAIFFREPEDAVWETSVSPARGETAAAGESISNAAHTMVASGYRAMMIDQGFCFNAGEWDFPDAPLRGLYLRQRVYESVTGLDAFEPWLERLDKRMTEAVLGEVAAGIPPEWYSDDWRALERLLARLHGRCKRVRELLLSARNSGRDPFPNWKVRHG